MANKISDETIEYVGILAKLELSDEEKEQAKKDMETMLDYIDTLNELDTEGIEPMSHVFPVNNVFREDVVNKWRQSTKTMRGQMPPQQERTELTKYLEHSHRKEIRKMVFRKVLLPLELRKKDSR